MRFNNGINGIESIESTQLTVQWTVFIFDTFQLYPWISGQPWCMLGRLKFLFQILFLRYPVSSYQINNGKLIVIIDRKLIIANFDLISGWQATVLFNCQLRVSLLQKKPSTNYIAIFVEV